MPSEDQKEKHIYQVDKITFIVTPVYKKTANPCVIFC